MLSTRLNGSIASQQVARRNICVHVSGGFLLKSGKKVFIPKRRKIVTDKIPYDITLQCYFSIVFPKFNTYPVDFSIVLQIMPWPKALMNVEPCIG